MNSRCCDFVKYAVLLVLVSLLAGCGGLSSEPKTVSTLIVPTDAPSTLTIAPPTAVQSAQSATQAATGAADVLGTVNGRIENGTKDGKVPPDMKLTLHLVMMDDTNSSETTFESTANAQGDFVFNDVPMRSDVYYQVTTTYLDRQLSSDPTTADPANKTLTIPLRIYETTSDPQVIQVASLITQLNADSNGLQVAQVIHLKNSSDRMFTDDKALNSDHPGNELFPSVSFTIPTGASLMGFGDTSGRFVTSADGTTVTDTAPVLPGEDHVVHFIYAMPYKSDGTTIVQPFPYPVNGPAQVYVTPTAVNLSSMQLVSYGLQNKNGIDYTLYGGTLTLDAGKSLSFDLRGQLPGAETADTQPSGSTPISRDLLIGLLIGGGFGLIVVGGVFLVYERFHASRSHQSAWSKRSQRSPASDNEALIKQLAELDEGYEGGKIDKAAYEKQRHVLKRRLARRLKQAG